MLRARMICAAALGVLGMGGIPSCATTSVAGTDSNTHWLDQCRTDKDCGSLVCRCGECTKPCSATSECTSLDASASCATSACNAKSKVCVAPCRTSADCPHGGTGFECRGGECAAIAVPDAASDGTCPDTVSPDGVCSPSGTSCWTRCAGGVQTYWACNNGHWQGTFGLYRCGPDAGANSGSDGSRAPDGGKDPCAPMDVHPSGTISFCQFGGYAWDGTRCSYVGCGCVGADCGSTWATEAECRTAKLGCLPPDVSISCVTGEDCSLQLYSCCQPCGEPKLSDTIPVNVDSVSAWHRGQQCSEAEGGACPSCDRAPGTIQAICQAGMCTSLDLAPVATCSKDDDCVLRAKDCCACGDLKIPEVVAINGSLGDFFAHAICGTAAKCAPCTPHYPSSLQARCDTKHGYCVATASQAPAEAGAP